MPERMSGIPPESIVRLFDRYAAALELYAAQWVATPADVVQEAFLRLVKQQFHLDEPWDGPHNKALLAKMPEVFAPENEELRDEGKTTILVPVGEKTIFGPIEGVAIKDITDGTSNTILAIDASEKRAVPWTKPADLNVDVSDLKSAIFGGRDQAICAFADGSVRVLSSRVPASTLQSLLTRNAGDVIPSADR
jgi:hypothetical protein